MSSDVCVHCIFKEICMIHLHVVHMFGYLSYYLSWPTVDFFCYIIFISLTEGRVSIYV